MSDHGIGPEEPWEAEISGMLRGLPPVEPPAGFIEAAIDHRPLHAGRTMAALALASLVAVIVATISGLGAGSSSSAAATIEVDDIGQAVSSHHGESVSVFVQPGRVDWSSLAGGGRSSMLGLPAWVDDGATIVQMDDEAVAVVGAEPDEVTRVVGALLVDGSSLGERLDDLVAALAAHLGFP